MNVCMMNSEYDATNYLWYKVYMQCNVWYPNAMYAHNDTHYDVIWRYEYILHTNDTLSILTAKLDGS